MPEVPEPAADDDPASAAVAHHLAALHTLWAEADPHTEGSTAAQLRHQVTRRAAGPLERRARAASDHLAQALAALAERDARQASWQREDHESLLHLTRTVGDLAARVNQLEGERAVLLDRLQALEALAAHARDDQQALTSDLHRLRVRQESVVAAAEAAIATGEATAPGQGVVCDDGLSLAELAAGASDDLYRDLERAFRGSREAVKGLAEVYLPDVRAVGGPVLDIGCGRGEWLELLAEHHIEAYGVDLNKVFAEENQARGLDVRVGDAVAHLASLEPASLGVVTGFHLAEHLPLEVLVDLADQAMRALRPGGLLILETPNPTNVRVGAGQFWIDPTHLRPLHPEFLQFLMTHRGFTPVDIRPLHPARHFDEDWGSLLGVEAPPGSPAAEVLEDLRDALAGPLDYAVLARSPA